MITSTRIRGAGQARAVPDVVRNVLGAAGVLVLLAAAGCNVGSAGRPSSIDVPLAYRPKDAGGMPIVQLPAAGSTKVYVSPTTDKRADARLIGENTEDAVPVPVYAAGKTPAEFVTDVLRQEMRAAGLDVADEVSGTRRQVDSELLQFRVTESSRYQGEVRLSVKVIDPTGKVVWQGVSVGTAGNFGRSRSVTNYQETFSTALQKAVAKILADPAFTQALTDAPAK